MLNLGSQSVTRTTTAKLTGPGLNFNKSVDVGYGANNIWAIAYTPGAGVVKPGIYMFQAGVAGSSTFTTRTYAVNP